MNDNNRDHSNNDLSNDMYSHIDHNNADLRQTNHNSLYTHANNELQISSDLEDLDWNSTDSLKGELIITYNNKVRYKTLHPRVFYALYVKPNEEGNEHLISRLSTDQIVVTKKHKTVPAPEDIGKTLCKSDPYENKSQVKGVDMIISTIHNDQSNNYDNNNHVSIDDEDQYLQVNNGFIQSLLLTSLQSKFTLSSLLTSLQSKFLLSSLLASLLYGFIQSSLLVSLRSMHIHVFTLISLWNLFLRCLYGDTSNIICI